MFGCHNSVVVVGFLLVVVVLLILCWRRRNIDEPVYDCMCSTSTQSMAKFVIRQMVNARCWQPMSAISIDVALFTERCKKKPRQQTGFACSTICKGTTSHFICFTHTRAVRSQPLWISCHLPLNCYNIIYRMCVWVCVQSLYKAQPLSTMLQLQTPLHEDWLRQTNKKTRKKPTKITSSNYWSSTRTMQIHNGKWHICLIYLLLLSISSRVYKQTLSLRSI